MNVPLFEAMADLLIPAGPDMPSASQAGAGTTGLADVLRFRPELKGMLEDILSQCEGKRPREALDALDATFHDAFAEIVASAYFMNEDVRSRLHYAGQRAQPIVSEDIDTALLTPVLDRGPIYRL